MKDSAAIEHYVKQRKHTKEYSCEEARGSHHDNRTQVFQSNMYQRSYEEEIQLENCLAQLEAENMNIAELHISRGGIMEVTNKHNDGRFHQTAKQLERFQEEVEEKTDALHEAQAEKKSVHKQRLEEKHGRHKSVNAEQEQG